MTQLQNCSLYIFRLLIITRKRLNAVLDQLQHLVTFVLLPLTGLLLTQRELTSCFLRLEQLLLAAISRRMNLTELLLEIDALLVLGGELVNQRLRVLGAVILVDKSG